MALCLTLVASVGLAGSLVLAPLVNQRPSGQHGWVGLYLVERLHARLQGQTGISLRSIELGRLAEAKRQDPGTDAVIWGNFQRVGDQVFAKFSVKAGRTNFAVELTSPLAELEPQLDQLASGVMAKLGLAYLAGEAPAFPQWQQPRHQRILQLRQASFTAPQPEDQWKDLVAEVGAYGVERELLLLAEVMLISGKAVAEDSRARHYAKVERLLKAGLERFPKSASLKALLAEAFYLMQTYSSWVEKTAEEAAKADPTNEVAWLMLALSRGPSTGGGREALLKLDALSPWIWPMKTDEVFFQAGLLNKELAYCYQELMKTKNPDPFQIP